MKINKKILLSITFVVCLGVAGIWHQDKRDRDADNRAKLYFEAEKLKMAQEEKQLNNLNKCLTDAKTEHIRLVKLNSILDPKEGYKDARRWNNAQVHETVEKKYKDEREFCLELYK